MAIITNAELWFCRLNPTRPNAKFSPANPTWECQLRTTSKEQKKEWEQAGLNVTAVVPDEGDIYFRVNLRKKSIKEDGSAALPVKVVGGDLEEIDPDSIGNGSIGNVRLYQYEYMKEGKSKATASILMGIQVTKLVKFKRKPMDEFAKSGMEVVDPDEAASEEVGF
jgi:hypothetical protein